MAKLTEAIKSQSDWIVKAFAADNLTLDYTERRRQALVEILVTDQVLFLLARWLPLAQ